MNLRRIPLPAPRGLKDVNAYLLPGTEPVLIDPGMKGDTAFEALEAGLQEHGVAVNDIEHVLITHPHADHFGNASRVKTVSGATVYAHELAAPIIADHEAHIDRLNAFFSTYFARHGMPHDFADDIAYRCIPDPDGTSVAIDHEIVPEETLDFAEGIDCIDAPGHARGNIVFRTREALITGDTVLADITPNPTLERPQSGDEPPHSLAQYLDTLKRIKEMSVEKGCGGHGPIIEDVPGRCNEILTHHNNRKQEVYRLLDAGGRTAYELMQNMFPGIDTHQYYFGMSEAIGHLQLLESNDAVRRTGDDPIMFEQV